MTSLTVKFNEAVGDGTTALSASALIASISDRANSPSATDVSWSADKKTLTITIPSTTFSGTLTVTFRDNNGSNSVIVDRAGIPMNLGANVQVNVL